MALVYIHNTITLVYTHNTITLVYSHNTITLVYTHNTVTLVYTHNTITLVYTHNTVTLVYSHNTITLVYTHNTITLVYTHNTVTWKQCVVFLQQTATSKQCVVFLQQTATSKQCVVFLQQPLQYTPSQCSFTIGADNHCTKTKNCNGTPNNCFTVYILHTDVLTPLPPPSPYNSHKHLHTCTQPKLNFSSVTLTMQQAVFRNSTSQQISCIYYPFHITLMLTTVLSTINPIQSNPPQLNTLPPKDPF